MCKYAGGKKRIAAQLHEVMRDTEVKLFGADTRLDYFEPFVGMFSIVKEFDDGRERTVCDRNPDLIKLWQAVLYRNWKPPKMNITESYYKKLKSARKASPERGFYGVACSFGGCFMSGYSGNAGADPRQLIATGYRNMLNYKARLKKVKVLDANSYDAFEPRGMLVYCDPPYARTVNYIPSKSLINFDHARFWNTMRRWSKHNLVFISEETAPKDFVCVWKTKINRTSHGHTVKCYDKLFVHSPRSAQHR